jgi:hypothetical protein
MDALHGIGQEKLINYSTRGEHQLKLLVSALDSLGDEAHPDTGKGEPLAQIQDIGLFP